MKNKDSLATQDMQRREKKVKALFNRKWYEKSEMTTRKEADEEVMTGYMHMFQKRDHDEGRRRRKYRKTVKERMRKDEEEAEGSFASHSGNM